MPTIQVVVFRIETPGRTVIKKSWPVALAWLEDQVLSRGHHDGFYAKVTVDVAEGRVPDDTDWLERKLGRTDGECGIRG